ncbi:kinesin motor domain-containing protein [Hirsutella rhossiliensis]|uniref:Kinesin-like protein n=1 Tax=Hirsutella rhossiliensis TaxID=111463 RepID=A0A9P8N4W0_9HYPO|nr:kinesin motor domain-containing protein [Hirsutella rhossiliensis]KAH0964692.1 kinesin motor domain-containing protein [Hirsutella rhossiliensis]
MDGSENQPARSCRLPGPTAPSRGLAEMSDSQHNTRIPLPPLPTFKGIKREISQAAPQPDAKRKPLSEKATEYPSKPSLATANPHRSTKGQSLCSMSQPKQPQQPTSVTRPGPASSSSGGFAKSYGPGRNVTADRHTAAKNGNRFGHARSKSQAPRPRTAHGHRDEVHRDDVSINSAWDVDGRVDNIELEFKELKNMLNDTLTQKKGDEDAFELAKARVSELEDCRRKLEERHERLKEELGVAKDDGRQLRHELEKQQWDHGRAVDDLERRHREAVEDVERQHRETDQEMKALQERIEALTRHHQQDLEDERQRMDREGKDREVQEHRSRAESLRTELERERLLKGSLQTSIAELSASNTTLEAKINSLKSHVEFLESDNKAQSDSFASMEARLQEALRIADEARQKLIKEETERRVLFNKYQELKGNIRVMCRVRPALDGSEGEEARMSFPDDKTSAEILLAGPEERSSLGMNEEIFGEISQLIQSALDGYNVCIFCYGQTGSGKTYTMSSDDGMIPRATHMIYETMTKLREKSWEYTMEGSFVEVYNEDLNDLLSPAHERVSSEGKPRKLEIRHDEARRQTAILNCKSVHLNSASSVERILQEAQRNRSVAATKANERSSRSHSVFILKLVGENAATGERCEGTLNLVDLAGSERLKQSQAEGERMKETQSINKSLSCLGDVIEALGRGSGHVPYRNSKLTHLLQYSLGGNSKTLMFVMVSPLEVHLKETLMSLRFATKVHNTHIGTAKATKKIKGGES